MPGLNYDLDGSDVEEDEELEQVDVTPAELADETREWSPTLSGPPVLILN